MLSSRLVKTATCFMQKEQMFWWKKEKEKEIYTTIHVLYVIY